MSYDVQVIPQSGSIIDGDMRAIVKVIVTYFPNESRKGQKVGTEIVRAATMKGAKRQGVQEARKMIRRYIATREAEMLAAERRLLRKINQQPNVFRE